MKSLDYIRDVTTILQYIAIFITAIQYNTPDKNVDIFLPVLPFLQYGNILQYAQRQYAIRC